MPVIANPFQNTAVLSSLLLAATLVGTGATAHAESLSVQTMTGEVTEQKKDEFLDFLCNNRASSMAGSKDVSKIIMIDACISADIASVSDDKLVIDEPKFEVIASKGWKFFERDNCYKVKGYYSVTLARAQGGVASYVLAPADTAKKTIITTSPNIKQCRW